MSASEGHNEQNLRLKAVEQAERALALADR